MLQVHQPQHFNMYFVKDLNPYICLLKVVMVIQEISISCFNDVQIATVHLNQNLNVIEGFSQIWFMRRIISLHL